MTEPGYAFAFGRPIRRTPPQKPVGKAKAFILGVYASAVHARWVDAKGKLACRALAVDIEPESFWDGADADERIAAVQREVPPAAGRLEPADPRFNGPSGRVLDSLYLEPLRLRRDQVWITDLHDIYYPSVGNAAVIHAKGAYGKLARKGVVPPAYLPDRPKSVRPSEDRLPNLQRELAESGADLVITLGNEPIRPLLGPNSKLLAAESYGVIREAEVLGRRVEVQNLCHPRQAGGLGTSSKTWRQIHERWCRRMRGRRKD